MNEAILITDNINTIETIKQIFEPTYDFTFFEKGGISYEDLDKSIYLSIGLGKFISEDDFFTFYTDDIKSLIKQKFHNPCSYLVEFTDFDFFKECLTILSEKIPLMINNDRGGMFTNVEQVKSMGSHTDFLKIKELVIK